MDIQRKETILLILDPEKETPEEALAALDRLQDIQVTGYSKFQVASSGPVWEVEILRRLGFYSDTIT